MGLEAGGLLSYGTRNRVATAARPAAPRALAPRVFPNPATAAATAETAVPTHLTLLDLTGRVVRAAGPAQRHHVLSLGGLAPGVYLLRAEGPGGTTAVQRLLVR